MEYLNRYFKESSKVSRGQLSDKTVECHALKLAVAEETKELWEMGLEFAERLAASPETTRLLRWPSSFSMKSFWSL